MDAFFDIIISLDMEKVDALGCVGWNPGSAAGQALMEELDFLFLFRLTCLLYAQQ